MLPAYAELHCRSCFSFLTGASRPQELVAEAVRRGYAALAITDECSLSGVVHAHEAALEAGLHLVIGAQMNLSPHPAGDGAVLSGHGPPHLVLLAQTRRGYGNLAQWISVARRRAPKGQYLAFAADLEGRVPNAPFLAGLSDCFAILLPQPCQPAESLHAQAMWLKTWFGADRCAIAVELLGHPHDAQRLSVLPRVAALTGLPLVACGDVLMHARSRKPLQDALTATQLLGNGRHAVLLRSYGGGHSLWDGLGLTRAQDDLPRSDQGSWFYLQRRTGAPWASLTSHPAPDPGARYSTRMQADRVVFSAEWPDLVCRNTVWVSPEDDCELRELVLCNTTAQPLTLHLVSCAEISLAPLRADEAHPAFSKLFVQAHWRAAEHALFLRRQPRLPGEQAVHAVHFLASSDGAAVTVQPCADRAAWLGRHGSPARPLGPATDTGHALAPMRSAIGDGGGTDNSNDHSTDHGTDHGTRHGSGPGASDSLALDTGLDPVALLRLQVTVPAGSELRLTFCTAASHSADSLDALVDRYRQPSHAARSASMSHTMAGIRLRELGFEPRVHHRDVERG